MENPEPLSVSLAQLIRDYPPGSHIRACADAMVKGQRQSADRRAAVLRHDDLAGRLKTELGYRRADEWNGWIPPALINEFSDDELLRSPAGKINERNSRATGERVNDSERRAALIDIATEAWKRERQLPAE